MVKLAHKLKGYSRISNHVCISQELSKDDMKKENDALILRRKMIADAFNLKHLRIRNLKLLKLVDKTWIIVSTVEEKKLLYSVITKISTDMHLLSFIVRSILSFERRTL